MTQYIDKSVLLTEMIRKMNRCKKILLDIRTRQNKDYYQGKREAYIDILSFINTLEVKVEPVSKDLEEATDNYVGHAPEIDEDLNCFTKRNAFIAGAQWKESNLWKDAQCDDLPEINREVIVLTKPYPLEGEFAVTFAHRPSPDGWVGKSVVTGKIEHFTPKTYGKGGWNIPDVKYWLDVELPKE